eukprot:7180339-Pyramimonas_sp.AAC.1
MTIAARGGRGTNTLQLGPHQGYRVVARGVDSPDGVGFSNRIPGRVWINGRGTRLEYCGRVEMAPVWSSRRGLEGGGGRPRVCGCECYDTRSGGAGGWRRRCWRRP